MRLARRTRVSATLLALGAAGWCWFAGLRPASAIPYERPIQIDREEDLYDLYAASEINEDTFRTLVELLRVGVDLNRAGREELYTLPNLTLGAVDAILSYRKEVGRILDPADLVAQGIISADDLLGIAPFLIVGTPTLAKYSTDGWVRAPMVWTSEDARSPATALQARVRGFQHLTAGGALVLTRNDLGAVSYDPNRNALTAIGPSTQVQLPKLFVEWSHDDWAVILGSYQIGFGQRLTFDTTPRELPNGWVRDQVIYRSTDLVQGCTESAGELGVSPCDSESRAYVTPDFSWQEGLFGAAIGARKLELQSGWVQAYAFSSMRSHSIYQYELYDRVRCEDPTDDDAAACKAPSVYRYQDDPLAPTSRFSYKTLPDMWREVLFGGNAAYFAGRRSHVGLTAYASSPSWLVDGMDLDFQEWSRWPRGGPFGAVGTDVAFGWHLFDWGLELTRSFDSMGEAGGGFGAILRSSATWKKSQVELDLRWYGQDFVNPYAGAYAAADELDGQRVRDEVGGRIRYTALLSRALKLRALADLWYTPSTDAPKALAYVRADYYITTQLDAGLWLQFQDKDLSNGGRGLCFEAAFDEYDETGEPIPCGGQQFRAAGRLGIAPIKALRLQAQYQHTWLDDPKHEDDLRQDLSAWLSATARLPQNVRLRARMRYLNEDVSDNTYLEQSLTAYLEAIVRLPRRLQLTARYDSKFWLDDRPSTLDRSPNPEQWIMAELEAYF